MNRLFSSVLNTIVSITRAIYYQIRQWILGDPEITEVIAARKKACDACTFNSKYNTGTDPFRFDDHCILCKCNIDLKVFDLDGACTIKKINASIVEESHKLPLGWDIYKPNPNG